MLASQSQIRGRSCKPRQSTTRHTEAIDPVWHATDFVRAKGKATGRNSTTACSTAAASMPGHCMLKGSSMVHQLWLFSRQELCRLRTYLCKLKRLLAKLSHRMKPPMEHDTSKSVPQLTDRHLLVPDATIIHWQHQPVLSQQQGNEDSVRGSLLLGSSHEQLYHHLLVQSSATQPSCMLAVQQVSQTALLEGPFGDV